MIKWIALALVLTGCSIIIPLAARGESLTFEFGNPSFSGQGFSTHALSIAQLEFNRKKDVEDRKQREKNCVEIESKIKRKGEI